MNPKTTAFEQEGWTPTLGGNAASLTVLEGAGLLQTLNPVVPKESHDSEISVEQARNPPMEKYRRTTRALPAEIPGQERGRASPFFCLQDSSRRRRHEGPTKFY